MKNCAVGFVIHTGWAAAAAVSGTLRDPIVIERRRIQILPDNLRFVYHEASDLLFDEAQRLITERTELAKSGARDAVRALVEAMRGSGYTVVTAAVPASKSVVPADVRAVLASHARIHAAEGDLYRVCLREALQCCLVPLLELGKPNIPDDWEATLRKIGKQIGPPWAADQKTAVTLAFVALG
jgi:hypothetical protein